MPQLNVAPSPSPVVASPAPANAASADASSANGAADSIPAQPFANLLRHQMSQHSSSAKSADKPVREALAAVEAEGETAVAQPAADAIAAIAQMLTGIVPPAMAQEAPQEALGQANAKGKKRASDDNEQDAVLLATAGGPAPATLPVAAGEATESETPTPISTGMTAADKAENFAAEGLQNAASHAASTQEEGKDFAALLNVPRDAHATAALQGTPHAAPGAESNVTHVRTPVGAQGWDNEVGEKLTWLVNRHETRADLVLNPPQLGRIEVSISMHGDQASASFVSASPAVREAIENAVPRLREILQDAGISLGQTQVGAESFQQSTANREKGDNRSRNTATGDANAQPIQGISGAGVAAALRRGNGLVDTFA